MNKHADHIEQTFLSGLDNYEVRPRSEVWEQVSGRLDTSIILALQKKYNRSRKMALALLFLLFSLAFYQVNIFLLKGRSTQVLSKLMNPIGNSGKPGFRSDKTAGKPGWPVALKSVRARPHSPSAPAQTEKQEPNTPDRFFTQYDSKVNEGAVFRSPASEIDMPQRPLAGSARHVNLSAITDPKKTVESAKSASFSRKNRFSIMPFFSPDLAWYHLADDQVVNQQTSAQKVSQEETHEFSYQAGAVLHYPLNKHWELRSGLAILSTNILIDPTRIYAEADGGGTVKYRINTSSGYGFILPEFSGRPAVGDSLSTSVSVQSLHYVGVPAGISYQLRAGKLGVCLTGGISANFLTRARLETTVENGSLSSVETIRKIEGVKKMYWSGLAGIGLSFPVNPKISFVLEPTFRIALEAINRNAVVKTYPMTFGSVAGVNIRF